MIISPRNLQNNNIEITIRDKTVQAVVDVADALNYIIQLKKIVSRFFRKFNFCRQVAGS